MSAKNDRASRHSKVLMLLTNAFDPDPRVHQEATALVEEGYEVTILCWDRDRKSPAKEVIDGISIERIYVRSTHGRGTGQILFLLVFWIRAFLRCVGKRFNTVHCHDFDTLPVGYVLARMRGKKVVYDAHESYVDMLINVPTHLKKLIYFLENYFLKRVDLVITVGEILKNSLESRGAKKACVVGNWKKRAAFNFHREDLEGERTILGVKNGQLVISFIANLGEERKLQALIDAVKDTASVFLLTGGNGPLRPMVEEAASRYSNVKYLGYVDPFRIPYYTALSDVVFYGFDPKNPNAKYSAPNKLFEALAAGKAVITGDFGEIGKIVKEYGCGIVLESMSSNDIKDALLSLHGTKLVSYQTEAKRAGEIYNWGNASNILLKEYRGLYDCRDCG